MPSFVTGANYPGVPRNPQKWLIEDPAIPAGDCRISTLSPKPTELHDLDMAEAIANPARHTWNGFAVLPTRGDDVSSNQAPQAEWSGGSAHNVHQRDFPVYFRDMQMVRSTRSTSSTQCVKWLRMKSSASTVLVLLTPCAKAPQEMRTTHRDAECHHPTRPAGALVKMRRAFLYTTRKRTQRFKQCG